MEPRVANLVRQQEAALANDSDRPDSERALAQEFLNATDILKHLCSEISKVRVAEESR